jgi:hypothetical protein
MSNVDPLSDDHDALTFHQLPAGVGDVTSNAKGSGARYNTGKPPYELIPAAMLADFWEEFRDLEHKPGDVTPDPVSALGALGDFQARRGDDQDSLMEVLRWLGDGGWHECAHVFDYGRKKYAAWNWAKGMAWSVPIACATRHLLAMIRGEQIDPESGLPHRGHVFCNVVMLYTFGRTYLDGDDRPPAGLL